MLRSAVCFSTTTSTVLTSNLCQASTRFGSGCNLKRKAADALSVNSRKARCGVVEGIKHMHLLGGDCLDGVTEEAIAAALAREQDPEVVPSICFASVRLNNMLFLSVNTAALLSVSAWVFPSLSLALKRFCGRSTRCLFWTPFQACKHSCWITFYRTDLS